MPSPNDFGLSPAETLAHTAPATRPPGFGQHWDRWVRRVLETEPELRPVRPDEEKLAGARGVTHVFTSTDDVRIGCRVTMPEGGNVAAMVVTSHGYHKEPGEPLRGGDPWSERGLGVVRVRVRGYPGSQFDTGDLTTHAGGYIIKGLEAGGDWVLNGALADLANAVRAARRLGGPDAPIMVHGESFGGGLAVIATSMLIRMEPVARLAMGVPTFGDWVWRQENPTSAGAGSELESFIDRNPERAEDLRTMVRLYDSVVHAARVVCPTVCKLALRDDVVPAPTAAAIFNALGTDPGHKWRFVVKEAHTDFEVDTSDVRRHAQFERLIGSFLDPREDLHTLMSSWHDTLRPS